MRGEKEGVKQTIRPDICPRTLVAKTKRVSGAPATVDSRRRPPQVDSRSSSQRLPRCSRAARLVVSSSKPNIFFTAKSTLLLDSRRDFMIRLKVLVQTVSTNGTVAGFPIFNLSASKVNGFSFNFLCTWLSGKLGDNNS